MWPNVSNFISVPTTDALWYRSSSWLEPAMLNKADVVCTSVSVHVKTEKNYSSEIYETWCEY